MSFFKKINAKEIPSVDLVKFIMAIFVIAIHTHPHEVIDNINLCFFIENVISLAVPFFFVASSFFLWRKMDDAIYTDRLLILRKWILHLIKLYTIWSMIYLPFTIYGYVIDGLSPLKALLVFVRNFLFVGENMYSWPLWYLLAMIVAGIIIYFMVYYRIKKSHIYAFALFALLLGIIIDNTKGISGLSSLYFKLFHTTRNGLFVGLPYLIIGTVIASNGIIAKRMLLISLLIISFTLYCYGLGVARYLVAYLLFSLVLGINIDNDDKVFKSLRRSSVVVYFVHMIFVGIITISNLEISHFVLFAIVTLISLLTSLIVVKYKNIGFVKLIFQ